MQVTAFENVFGYKVLRNSRKCLVKHLSKSINIVSDLSYKRPDMIETEWQCDLNMESVCVERLTLVESRKTRYLLTGRLSVLLHSGDVK